MTTGEVPFYFYTYYRNRKVTLHKGDCSFCNNGKGLQHTRLGYAGRWRGGYSQLDLALEAAHVISQQLSVEPGYCKRCFSNEATTETVSVMAFHESPN